MVWCRNLLRNLLIVASFLKAISAMTLEEQYNTLMEAAGRISDQWCRDKFIEEADSVLLQINAQVLKNKQEVESIGF